MLLTLLAILCVLCALTTLLTFILYVRARMAIRDEHPYRSDEQDEQYSSRNAGLDRREQTYRSIHFITLFAFVVLGVIILVILSGRAE